uniref:Uncharacterized protein n=1 Tax=Haemonchus contortus TaxID=6289 RepID=A0A7I4YNE4_HAECO
MDAIEVHQGPTLSLFLLLLTEHHHKKISESKKNSQTNSNQKCSRPQGVTDKYLESDLAVDGSVDQAVGTLINAVWMKWRVSFKTIGAPDTSKERASDSGKAHNASRQRVLARKSKP